MIGLLAQGFVWSGYGDRREFGLAVAVMFVLSVSLQVAIVVLPPFHPAVRIGFLLVALFTYPFFGLAVRRLHDLGLNGIWAALLFVPVVGLGLVAVLLLFPRQGRVHRPSGSFLARGGQAAVLCLALLLASRMFWAPLVITGEAMAPNLLPGDVVILRPADRAPARGQILAIGGATSGVLRLVGLPGDRIQMIAGRPWLNGAAVRQQDDGIDRVPYRPMGPERVFPMCNADGVPLGGTCTRRRLLEWLPGKDTPHAVLDTTRSLLDDTAPTEVPSWAGFFLGDNRDKAADSRLSVLAGGPGLIDMADVTGQVRRVLVSFQGRAIWQIWTWRRDRAFMRVE